MQPALDSEPKLAPPGAGLPFLELVVARILFRGRMLAATRESSNAMFQQARTGIRTLIEPLNATAGSRRVLIPRLRGMEDSSRYWSVWMVLDHLRIVNTAMAGVIAMLGRGKRPPGVPSTAAVKPDPDVTAAVLEGYEKSCDDLLAAAAGVAHWRTPTRYPHPWFGRLDAAGWHTIAGFHMQLHRNQIEQILRLASSARD